MIYILLIISLIALYFYNSKKNKVVSLKKNYTVADNNCNLKLLTPEVCYKNNINLCPMSSYKQCTNNTHPILYPPLSKCSCNSFGLELCENPESNYCNIKKCNIKKINQFYPINSCNNPRVNIYNTI